MVGSCGVRGALVVIVLALWSLLGASPAAAHPVVLFTNPALDSAVTDTPESVTMVFNEPVSIRDGAITLLDHRDREVALGPVQLQKQDTAVTVPIRDELSRGIYRVRWDAIGVDGHGADGEFRFAVGTAVTGDSATATASGGWAETDWVAAALKFLLVAGFVLAVGGLAGGRIAGSVRRRHPELPGVRPWTGLGAAVGAGAAAGAGIALVTELGTISALWASGPGRVTIAEAAGFVGALTLSMLGARLWAAVPLALVPIAEGVASHAQIANPVGGAMLTAVHLTAAAVWIGALIHVLRVLVRWRGSPAAVRSMVWGYARLAIWILLLLVATGTTMALLLVPLDSLLGTAYGTTLLVKLALVAGAVGLAAGGRWALGRRRLRVLGRTVPGEVATLSLVVVVTSVLVSMPTPDPEGQAAPPPPPRGVTVPAGGLAGQVGVNVAASKGQVVVRLYTPTRGNAYEPADLPDFELSGQLEPPGEQPEAVPFRSCGGNCFVAKTSWRDGDNVLTLRAGAEGWRGGSFAALIPWPAKPADHLVKRTVRVMHRVGRFTLYEAGTSDASDPMPDPLKVRVDGEQFLSNEPYNSGVASIAAMTTDDSGRTQLRMSFPTSGFYAALTLDGLGRIVEETLTGPKHVFHRRFVYQASE